MSTNPFDLTGRCAIVTGASRGLGQYMARALAGAGADLIITARKREDCEPFAEEMRTAGRRVTAYALDVTVRRSVEAFTQRAVAEHERIDILVNNAGCNVRKPSVDMTWDDWDMVLNTNLRGAFFISRDIGKAMIGQGYGKIINVGSVTCLFGYSGIVPYSASRGGVLQMTRALASEWGEFGITVNCLGPGWFETEQNKVLYQDKKWVEYLVEKIPVGRPGAPHDLDGAVIFLASDASQYVTGQLLMVDGGITTGNTRALPTKA